MCFKEIEESFKDHCGIFGIYRTDKKQDSAKITYFGLYALQHRGQESSGIAVNDSGNIIYHKDNGLVNEVFNEVVLNHLKGHSAIGHVRYSTTGKSDRENAQPLVVKYRKGHMALAHNGNLVNAHIIREKLEQEGVIFQTTIDSEVIANLISRNRINSENIEEAILKTMDEIKGAYSLLILTPNKLIAVRDPYGLRPLVMGKINNNICFASETCALDTVGAEYIRDVEPGEIVSVTKDGIKSIKYRQSFKHLCVFEFIYFARADSYLDGISVYEIRKKLGKQLCKESYVECDIVIGVPDSGTTAAIGFAEEAKIPFSEGFIKNRYIGRTFIKPEQSQREIAVRLKLNPLKSNVTGKRVVLIDDSIVRGTTSRKIIKMLRDAGAREVHLRISSPPVLFPCYYGIDTPDRNELIAANYTPQEIAKILGADSLEYLSLEGLNSVFDNKLQNFCTACFSGKYVTELPENFNKYIFEEGV
ncbi:amidophosphoribosyltransferase [Caldicellulosiruptor changbaiensis]|uniref:Amidophosphoribosyltransferase n=1 Tax=Caldicellulosiruptor changbaiensis TaxID=1222016 RepID=A0A3T0D5A1_9FIRM|nr:amidophosphoribosyltransferase [Caldicellulosiruptor changbaiensis]AZT90261.1 amidophosphoribosyltransferase [Caldicellulosiruptor changbaiensis]